MQNAPRYVASAQTHNDLPPLCSGLLSRPKRAGDRRARSPSATDQLHRERPPTPDDSGRSGLLGPSVANVVGVERDPGHRPARHSSPLASQGISAVLAIYFEARTWPTSDSAEVQTLIRRFAKENGWRARKVRAELRKLGILIGLATVSRTLPKRDPDHDQRQRWRTFLRNHSHGIAGMDFRVVPTIRFQLLYAWFVISHDRRKIVYFGVTAHPTAL